MINKSEFWSVAHVDHDNLRDCLGYADASFDSDMDWFKYLSEETPNGELLRSNVLYDTIRSGKIYLAHITKSFKAIEEGGKILSSSGCLVGSVYCTPVVQEGGDLRLHNLGSYILSREAPKFSQAGQEVALLLIELELPHSTTVHPAGVDYLKLGMVHYSVFSELSYLLSRREFEELKNATIDAIRGANTLLSVVHGFTAESIAENFKKFYKLYQETTVHLPILGYFLFETLCEYIALYQHGEEVERHREIGEIYCTNFKNLTFSLCPDLTRAFNLGTFRPDLEMVIKYLKTINVIQANNEHLFIGHLVRRLQYFMNSRFLQFPEGNKAQDKLFWRNVEWDFAYLEHGAAPLLGHTIHRLLRNMHRYPNFYFYFDQYKALQAWNYWNHAQIALPYNAVLPKGEIGINPAYPELKYRIFKTSTAQKNGHTYVTREKELPFIIEPRLAELNMLLMRKKS